MGSVTDRLRNVAEGIDTVIGSAVAFITDLKDQLASAVLNEDMEAISAILDEIEEDKEALALAIVTNTAAEADETDEV